MLNHFCTDNQGIQNFRHSLHTKKSLGECMRTEMSKFASYHQESPLILGTRKLVVFIESTSLEDFDNVIADVARMLHFVQASQPY